MEYTHLLLRYGELFLKGKNQPLFGKKLMENIKKIAGINEVKKIRGRLILSYFEGHQKLTQVFGLVSYSPVVKTGKNLESIKQVAFELLGQKKGTFRVETQRSDKQFPLTSPEINAEVGRYIEENNKHLEFNFKNYDFLLCVEINQEGAYLFLEKIPCGGGLPTGVEGKVLLLVEEEASLLAGLLFMKRGCAVIPLGIKEKKLGLLQKFSPEKLSLIVVKSFREVEEFAAENKINMLVSGQNYENYRQYKTKLTIFRPLIGVSEKEIKEKLKSF